MRGRLKTISLAVLVAGLVPIAFPAVAQATLTYVKNLRNPVVYAANDDGSGAHKVGRGTNPRVSPDGQWIVYLHEGPKHAQEMKLVAASGGGTRTLLKGWREPFQLAFAPDSKTIAVLRGPEIGNRKLITVDLASGAQQLLASGAFSGFSFSPDSRELVYAKAKSERTSTKLDVFRTLAAGGPTQRLTSDHRSQSPLWGPQGQIVFVKQLEASKRRYGPKNDLFLMNAEGKQVKRLTHTKVAPLLLGLFPTEWSSDGTRLLCEFEGQDTSYAVAVDPRTGAERVFGKAEEQGFVGIALSADGNTVLGFTGGFEPGPRHDVATVPYTGGKPKTLVANAFEADWSG